MNFSSLDPSAWRPEAVLVPLGFSLIFLLGVAGNSLVLCVPFQATIYSLDRWVFGSVLCRTVHFLIFLTLFPSIFTPTAVSLDRYLAIHYPLRSREIRTPKNTLASICLVWVLALFFSSPYLSYFSQMDLDSTPLCVPVWESGRRIIMDVCTFVFGYLVPVLVLSVTYACTVRHLWTSVDPVKDQSESRRAKRMVTKMVIVVAALFCLCWLPHHIVVLWIWSRHFPLNDVAYVLRILSHLVAYAKSCLNPVVYALVSKHFRRGFRTVFRWPTKRRVSRVRSVQVVNTCKISFAVREFLNNGQS